MNKRFWTIVLTCALVTTISGCQQTPKTSSDVSLGSSPSGSSAGTAAASETSEYPFITEPSGSGSGESTEATKTAPVAAGTVSVPNAGVSFMLPDGWTLASASRDVRFYISPDGTEFLNVMTGVNAVPQLATGTEAGLYSFTDMKLSDLRISQKGITGNATGLALLNDAANLVVKGNNVLSAETFTFQATLTGTALDEYGKMIDVPIFPSVYYAFARTDTPTGIIFVLSKTPNSGADLNADLGVITQSISQYAETLSDLSLATQTFVFKDLGITFDMPEGYVSTSLRGAYRIALPSTETGSSLSDIQINIYPDFTGAVDNTKDVCDFLMTKEFYFQFWDQTAILNMPINISELVSVATDGQSYIYDLGNQSVWGYQTRILSILTDDQKAALPDAGSFYFTTYAFRNGTKKMLLTISGPNNASSMTSSVQKLMSSTFIYN